MRRHWRTAVCMAACALVGWEASMATGLTLVVGGWLLKGGER